MFLMVWRLCLFTDIIFKRCFQLKLFFAGWITTQINMICPISDKFGQFKHKSISSKILLGNLTILIIISKSHCEVARYQSHSNRENPIKLFKCLCSWSCSRKIKLPKCKNSRWVSWNFRKMILISSLKFPKTLNAQ